MAHRPLASPWYLSRSPAPPALGSRLQPMPNRSSTKTTLSRPSPPAPSPPRRQRAFRSPRAAELLAAHFRQRIIRGELKEGDRLPKQQDLMEEFGISRSTFREAFLLLESEGLLSVLQGTQGAVIHRP